MEKKSSSVFLQVLLVLVVFLLQLISIFFNQRLIYQLRNLEYGAKALGMTLLSIGTGMASGIGTAFIFLRNQQKDRKKDHLVGAIIFVILSCWGILWKILFSAFGFLPFSVLRPVLSELFTWMMDSQLPSFWAGLAIGWFVNRKE
ncbi:MAG TPA: hypothetical protein DCK95_08485 [Anaerolineaceae bacterium]|nr:hypothetical protein [Anaerolineaceae bacterium]